ncbi:hypothetical protein K0M31_018397 [Melipona bicolor]|uniref:Uncharacterized protein n=1 Tax=Melipona bicolor TaxID=60889 RepID=A0AA40G3D8_9HYME|nr:hypothetical protein K0M31_018397 [Melipona bicolor]
MVGTKRNKKNKHEKKRKKKKKGASNTRRSRDTFKSPSGCCQSVVITSEDGKKQGPSSFVVWPGSSWRWSPEEEGEKARSGETMIVSHEPN